MGLFGSTAHHGSGTVQRDYRPPPDQAPASEAQAAARALQASQPETLPAGPGATGGFLDLLPGDPADHGLHRAARRRGLSTPVMWLIGGGSVIACLLTLLLVATIAVPVFLHERVIGQALTTVSMPQTVAGFGRLTDAKNRKLARDLSASFPGFQGRPTQAAVYGATPDRPRVAVAGGTHRSWQPKAQRDFIAGAEDSLRSDSVPVVGIQDIGPGPLGGIMRCGVVPVRRTIACLFADARAYGLIIILNQPSSYAVLARQVRADIEHRS
jgi:hypothetical protein